LKSDGQKLRKGSLSFEKLLMKNLIKTRKQYCKINFIKTPLGLIRLQ
jgi:hypothetical protein